MLSEKEHDIVDELSRLLLDTLMLAKPPQLPERYAALESLQTVHADLLIIRDFLFAVANGDLSRPVPFKGFVAGTLKMIQSNLRHITWQTKMVASGDFTQRIEFMGEFSHSFNAMVIQLDQTLQELVRKEEELSRANTELLKEIHIRKETEVALRKSEEALRVQAITDPLTGLYNRRHFAELADVEILKALRYSRALAIVMFDIDFFKRVNDNYGHASGDAVLKMVARTTKETLRASDISARYGGEEFVVLLPETTLAQAAEVADRVRRRIADSTVQTEECPITVTVSFGVSGFVGENNPATTETILSKLVANADQALYASKNAGRNRVTVYTSAEESAY